MKEQDLFQEIIDPYESSFQAGKEDGRKAALDSGYNEGYQLGKLKGLELGIELGYMTSICKAALQGLGDDIISDDIMKVNDSKSCASSSVDIDGSNKTQHGDSDHDHERKKKRIKDLLDAIEAFPKPKEIFQNSRYIKTKENQEHVDVNSQNNDADITSLMQRLRAKFKTVLVQLDLTNLRLQNIMDQSIKSNDRSNVIGTAPRLDEW